MDREKIKEILDNTNISVIDELNILDYIDVFKNRIDKAIEKYEKCKEDYCTLALVMYDILRGEDNDKV